MWPFKKKTAVAIPAAESDDPLFSTHRGSESVLGDARMNYTKRALEAMQRSFQRTHADLKIQTETGVAMDDAMRTAFDNNIQQVKELTGTNQGFLPLHVIEWYSAQGFIGWQMCAILAQQWLINKACKMPGQDAVRHGWERSVNKDIQVPTAAFDKLREYDKFFKLKSNLIEHYKFARVFGIRHTLFLVDGIDYSLPFNPDGVRPGTYKGMTQVDPYWLAPMFSIEDAADPLSPNFYNPTWWLISGRLKVHRSHFVISRNGNDVADILKPTYFYGGISTAQLIYERVYASERTANESPLLAMTKRLTTLKTDTTKAMANLDAFKEKLLAWIGYRDNFGVKVLGKDEVVEQIDTSLQGLDETIMTQFQLDAAIAEIPATKLLGTSPKGFGASGEYEQDSYYEFLESIQENELSPIVDRHTLLCQRSFNIAPEVNFETQWKSVDTPGAKEQSEINLNKANTDKALIDAGSIEGQDSRRRLIKDPDSGYNGIDEEMEGADRDLDEGEPEGGGEDDNE